MAKPSLDFPFAGNAIRQDTPVGRLIASWRAKIIDGQSATIAKLQDDVERLSKGCGHPELFWRGR